MIKKHNIILSLLLLFGGAVEAVYADGTNYAHKAIIHGNIYGGGEIAKVEEPEEQRSTLPATKVTLRNGAEVYGAIFGAGKGNTKEYVEGLHNDKTYKNYAYITGNTEVNLVGSSIIWQDMFGGGENADVKGSTFFNMSAGEVAANVFGGGKGNINGSDITYADISGNTNVSITGGSIIWNKTSVTKEGTVEYDKHWYIITVPEAVGKTTVYEFDKEQTDAEKNAILANFPTGVGKPYKDVSISGPVHNNDKYQYTVTYTINEYTTREWYRSELNPIPSDHKADGIEHVVINTIAGDVWEWDPSKEADYKDEVKKIDNSQFYDYVNKRFLIEHNILGGGYLACNVGTWNNEGKLEENTGLAKVKLTKGLFDMDLIKTEQWKAAYNDHEHPHFYLFGGGYGIHTKVGQTDVYAALPIDKTIGSTTETNEQLAKPNLAMKTPYSSGSALEEKTFDIINNSYGLPRATVLGILGGGYNGYVGSTNVVIGGATFTHRVYGGGLGSLDGWTGAVPTIQNDDTGYAGIVNGDATVTLVGGHIYGDAFGGGAGVAPKGTTGSFTDYPQIANVNGTTTVRTFSNKDYYNYMKDVLKMDPAAMPYIWTEGLEITEPNIYGSVYGGGDVANVKEDSNVKLHAGNVFGYTIGAGYGRKATEANNYTTIGMVGGDANVVIENGATTEPYAWNDIYGGGRNGHVAGSAYVHLNGGYIGDNVFGGGWGAIDNPGASEVVTSANVAGNTVVTLDKTFALWNKIADVEGNIKTWNHDDYIREATDLKGVDPLFYNIETKRFVKDHNIYGGGNVACIVGTDGNSETFTAQQLAKQNDFLRATLKAGAYKTGNTIVMMNESHVSDPDIFYNYAEWTDAPRWSQSALCWLTTLTEQREPQFSVFGGGYGLRTKTLHDAQARVEVLAVRYKDPEKTQLAFVDDDPSNGPVEHWTTGWNYDYEHKLEWTEDENNGGTKKDELANFYPNDYLKPNYVDAERRLRTAAFAKQIGVAGNSVMQVVGGGYNGSVAGNTLASAQSRVIVGKIYGGGYGSLEGWLEANTVSPELAATVGTVGGKATVDIDRGSLVYGDAFGGGAGVESCEVDGVLTDFPDVARVGSTHVKLGAVGASEKYDFVVPVVYGSLYGGGDVANVTGNAVTDLHRGQVMQYLFGGGNGRLKYQCADYTTLGSVNDATVNFHAIRTKPDTTTPYSKYYGDVEQTYAHEPIVWQRSYGGGRNGLVRGNTNITIDGGQFGHNIFGGGWGAVTDKDGNVLTDDNGIVDPNYADKNENEDYFITSADVKGNTNIVVNGGTVNIDQIWDYANRQWTKSNYDEKGNSYSPQYDFKKTLFTIKHNIYTGGNRASNIGTMEDGHLQDGTGNTNVTLNRGMLDHQFFEKLGTPFLESFEWRDVYQKHGTPFFCIFGGGYGENATVYGNTNVNVNIPESDALGLTKTISPVTEETGHNHSLDGDEDIAGCSGVHDRQTINYTKFPDAQSIMDVVGGGYNGPVMGTCNVTVQGNPFIRNIFGGAYYSPVGSTNVSVVSGNIDNIYGGGMMGDVNNNISVNVGTAGNDAPIAANNARLVILGDVYGGNDVSGLAGAHYENGNQLAATESDGVAINLNGGHIKGNVYGGGNGNYLYMVDKNLDGVYGKVTAEEQYEVNGKEKLVYRVPMREDIGGFEASNEEQRIINIATYRPVTIKTEISMQGNAVPAEDADYLKIDGSVFGGGNSATVSDFSIANSDNISNVTLNIGSNINVGAVYLGNDGEAMFTNEAENSFLRDFPTLNNLTLSNSIDWTTPENASISETYFTTPKSVRPQIYKNLLDLYFLPVEMRFVPKVYWGTGAGKLIGNTADVSTSVLHDVTIGTFCCGGNRGNMTTTDHVSLVFPVGLTITDKIVGGCNDANYQMGMGSGKVTEHIGGYLYGTHQFAYTQTDDKFNGERETTAPQIHLIMKNKFQLKMDEDGIFQEAGNVYGGCYKSGNVRGDIEVDMRSDMLVDAAGNALDEDAISSIRSAFENEHKSVASIYGAGYGTNTFVYGDTRVTLGNATANNAGTNGNGASVYNIFGGGQQGNLIGTSHVQIINGQVAGNTVGGSYAGYQYGSTNVLVGYPRYYIAQQSGRYTLLRKDNNADHLAYVDAEGNKYVKQEIYLLKGAGVSNAVMSEITHKDGVDITSNKSNYFTQITSHYTPASFGLAWDDVDINVNRAIYGGGYSLASGSSVGAGAKTVCKMTEKYNMNDFKELYGIANTVGYGGNTNVMLCDLTPNNELNGGEANASENDHITLSTGIRTQVFPNDGDPLVGLYYKSGSSYVYVNSRDIKYPYTKHAGEDATEADARAVEYYRYTGEGGLFGDGHLSLSEGFRFGEVTRYGFAGTTPADAKLMNCIHRFDIVRVKDCCMALMGDRDYVSTSTGGTDTAPYSIARVGELQMTSDIEKNNPIDLGGPVLGQSGYVYTSKGKRNYIGLSSNVRNLGCLYSDVATTATRHKANGSLDETVGNYSTTDIPLKSYEGYKSQNIEYNYDYDNYKVKTDAENQKAFMKRNDGTAHNLIGIASGLALYVQDAAYKPASTASAKKFANLGDAEYTDEEEPFYGPLKGIVEVCLINVVPGEAGGYVYADNNHKNDHSFLEEEGNVVYPINDNSDSGRKLVDQCFPTYYSAQYNEVEGHYWYVTGYKYFYECNISAYTSDDKTTAKDFKMKYNIGSLRLTDYDNSKEYLKNIKVTSFRFLPHDDNSYPCDIDNNGKYNTGHTGDIGATDDRYELVLKVRANEDGTDNNDHDLVCRLGSEITSGHEVSLNESTIDLPKNTTEPIVDILLVDKVTNNSMDVGDGQTYFEKYLSQPCRFEVVLEVPDTWYNTSGHSEKADETYTYTITTTIQYVQGPNYTGDIDVSCALPGEMIRLSKKNLQIKTDEISMPKIAEKWEVGKLSVTGDPGHEVYSIDQTGIINRAFTIDASHVDGMFGDGETEAAENDRELPTTFYDKTDDYIYIPAYYYMNGYGVKYSFKVQGVEDWIPVAINPEKNLLIHNYHRMKTGKDEGGKLVDVKIRKAAERAATEREDHVANPLPLPRVYIEDVEDMNALNTYLADATDPNTANGANVDFHLMKDITVPTWTAPTTFAGNFHGNGHVLRINAEQPLFATNSGKVYNLGMNNSSVANTNAGAIINSYAYGKHIVEAPDGETLTNCYTNMSDNSVVGENYATEAEWKYGKVAYDLNGYYIDRREHSNARAYAYVEDLYRNGDYQYALQHSDAAEYLRTNNLPHYGGKTSYHMATHDMDAARAHYHTGDAVKKFDEYQPLYESAKIDADATAAVVKNDYLFFAQQMQKGKDILPSTITPASHAVADMHTRVYRAYGYMHSKLHGFNATTVDTDPGFYFNRMAYVYNPALTAINFTEAAANDLNIDIPLALQQFNLDGDVTRNLLVYTEPQAVGALTYDVVNTALNYNENKAESEIKGHQLIKLAEADANGNIFMANAGANNSQSLFHLVERAKAEQPNNDFNAPIAFSVGTRAWYTRQPKYYAEFNNDAWEGIALPFTANKVEASLNGEITHFYGTPTQDMIDNPETNDKTLHHEYWLRGLLSVASADGKTTATFQRPGAAVDNLFATGESMDYSFHNDWFVEKYAGKNYNYDDPSNQNKWYSEQHSYTDYKPLTANVPYIVSFPGNRFYEFDLSSQFYNEMIGGAKMDAQTVTFNNYVDEGELLTIRVTDDSMKPTMVNSYQHNATYCAIDNAAYAINATGTTFDDDVKAVLPFRTYITKTDAKAVNNTLGKDGLQLAKGSIIIGSMNAKEMLSEMIVEPGKPESGFSENGLIVYPRGNRIIVESSYDTTLMIHTYGGQLMRVLDVRQGTNTFSGFASGIYIINGKKLVVR